MVEAPSGECAVNKSVRGQERQRSRFGWWIGGRDAASPLLGPKGSTATLHGGHQSWAAGHLS